MSQKTLVDWLTKIGTSVLVTGDVIQANGLSIYYVYLNDRTAISHLNKPMLSINNGIILFSDEWFERRHQCEGVISAKLGLFDIKLMARKCQLAEVPKVIGRTFLEMYHVQGSNNLSLVYFGLYYDKDLVGLISLGRHSRQIAENRIVLDRLCFKSGVQIVGGASRLLRAAIKWSKERDYDEIISFSDKRWSSGSIYKKLG